MSRLSKLSLLGVLVLLLPASSPIAQDTEGKKNSQLDFSKDPCGSPLIESMLWQGINGKVTAITHGHTILLKLHDDNHLLRVHLAGIKLSGIASSDQATREFLTKELLSQDAEVLVNPTKWDYPPRRPGKVTGVVHSRMKTSGYDDVAQLLLEKGLVMYEEPKPYTMSAYTACTYRHAEAEARSKKLGLWQRRGR